MEKIIISSVITSFEIPIGVPFYISNHSEKYCMKPYNKCTNCVLRGGKFNNLCHSVICYSEGRSDKTNCNVVLYNENK